MLLAGTQIFMSTKYIQSAPHNILANILLSMDTFNQFLKTLQVKEKQENAKNILINPAERINYFKTLVSGFFNHLENEWLGDSIKLGLIQIEKGTISIEEEAIGKYEIDKYRLKLGMEIIDFIPIGTILIGTDARIDMVYKQTRVMFVRVGEKVNRAADLIHVRIKGEPDKPFKDLGQRVWKYTYKNSRSLYETATAESVQKIIMDVINEKA